MKDRFFPRTLNDTDQKLLQNTDPALINFLFSGHAPVDRDANSEISNATIEYTLPTNRSEESIF